jgi:hypothetical protein
LQLYADGGYQLRIRRLEGTPNYGPRQRRRAQAREGLPLEASPITKEEEDDDEEEGMKVHMGFSPDVRPRSAPASEGSSGGTVPSA